MDETTQQQEKRPLKDRPGARRLALVIVIVAVSLIFIFENAEKTTIRLLVPEVTMPLWGALLIAWLLGLLVGAYTLRRRR